MSNEPRWDDDELGRMTMKAERKLNETETEGENKEKDKRTKQEAMNKIRKQET
jgi:hypothetical protein